MAREGTHWNHAAQENLGLDFSGTSLNRNGRCVRRNRWSFCAIHHKMQSEHQNQGKFHDKLQLADFKSNFSQFVTEGILLREMLADPLLSEYSVIMIDEAHERNNLTDVVMGLLKKIAKVKI